MAQKMAYSNQPLPTQTDTVECDYPAYRLLPLAAVVIARRREMAVLPPEEPPQVEICLSPLLWSESFGLLVDG